MHAWTDALIALSHADDIQWRYDELNNELLTALEKGYVSYDEAKSLINFLGPDEGLFPKYYNPKSRPLSEVVIQGTVSLLDLDAKTIESHYGYFGDEWVKISLPNYLDD